MRMRALLGMLERRKKDGDTQKLGNADKINKKMLEQIWKIQGECKKGQK